jgi:hypothetical protein
MELLNKLVKLCWLISANDLFVQGKNDAFMHEEEKVTR